jgi:site-specific recombinase XerD
VPAGRLTTLIEDAIKTFVETTAAKGVTEKHIRVLKYDLGNFAQFALNRGLVNLGDVRTEDCAAYSNQLTGAINTRAKKVFRLIGFFSFCIEMNWIQRNPAQTRAVIIKKSDAQKPKALDEAQFAQLLEAVQKMNGQTTDQQKRAMRSLVLLMKWSGLAVRDAVTIERAKFEPNGDGFTKLYLHRAKTGHAAFATLENEIVAQIMAGANPSGKYLFIDALPTSERAMDNLISNWGNLFSKLGECADLKDADGVPFHFTSHCLRHSFAFFCFNSGMPTEDVAMLLGDSVAVVAAHYSGWVQGRQERLTERMKAALASRHQK